MDCFICRKFNNGDFLLENDLAFALWDGFPVTKGHALICPKRHEADYFELTEDEILAIHDLIHRFSEDLSEADASVTGFNIGINCGKSAGQTVFHCHVHLIPRRDGDVENPKGGVRGVIPGKMGY